METIRFCELFAGIGGFRYGLERVQFEDKDLCKSTSEIRDTERQTEQFNNSSDKGLYDNEQARLENISSNGEQQDNTEISRDKNSIYPKVLQPSESEKWRYYTCVYANDNNKYAAQIYRKNFGGKELYEGDITKIKSEEIPDFDLLTGGFPCQAFSIAGKRLGFNDTRGTLFFEIARILRDKTPRYFLLENVRGLLSHNNGQTFQTILEVLSDIGYVLQWEVLNSKNYGVPQNRERVFIIGHLRRTRRPEVFPIRGISKEDNRSTNKIDNILIMSKDGIPKNKDYASTLSGGAHSGGNHSDMDLIEITKDKPDAQRIYDTDGIAKTLKGLGGGQGGKTGLYAMRWQRTEKGKEARRESQANGKDYTPFSDECREVIPVENKPVGALTSQAIAKDSLVGNEFKIRRLTPSECERLQAFPDRWTEKGIDTNGNEVAISDTQRYKMLGNAVTTNVITAIGERLLCSINAKTAN